MFGQQAVTLMIEDAILGVQKPYSGIINVGVSYSKYSSEAVTGLSSVVIPIVIDETILTAGDILYNYFRSYSPYEIAVQNGYQGTEPEFNEQLGNFENLANDAEQAKEDAEAAALQAAQDRDYLESELFHYIDDDEISVRVGLGTQVLVSESTTGYPSVILQLHTA
jgi:hypothetical protein